MNRNYFLNELIFVFILVPLILLIHELGHAFFIKISNGKVNEIRPDIVKKSVKIGLVKFNLFYLRGATIKAGKLAGKEKASLISIYLGGVLFNIISILICKYIILGIYTNLSNTIEVFIKTSIYMVIFNLFPYTYGGYSTDGKLIYHTLKHKKSKFTKSSY